MCEDAKNACRFALGERIVNGCRCKDAQDACCIVRGKKSFIFYFLGSSTISIDYYNRSLSGWEPFVEPWKAKFNLSKSLKANDASPRFAI